MGAVATFDMPTFAARYPEFASLPPALASSYFAEASLYLRNDGSGPVQDPAVQLLLLNMLTAHLAQLNAHNADGSAASTLVGPITSATEGSVSVSTGLALAPGSEAWFAQTKYGYQFWSATAAYRSFQYLPRQRALPPYGGGYGYGRY